MSTIEQLVAALVAEGVIGVSEDGRIVVNGNAMQPYAENTVELGSPTFDENGYSDADDNGAVMLEGIEAYRQELETGGFPNLAKSLPQRYMVPPAAMDTARDVDEWRKAHPDWSKQQLQTAMNNCRRATLPGYTRMIREAYALHPEERWGRTYWVMTKNPDTNTGVAIPNTRAVGIGFAADTDDDRALHDAVVEAMRRRWDEKKNPSPWSVPGDSQ